jgi:hypothetical protein
MNPVWIEEKYIHLLQPRLEKFERKAPGYYNFRCPLCGDSQKNKRIKRGYLKLLDENGYYYSCFNDACSIRKMSFNNFLMRYDKHLHESFRREMMVEKYDKPRRRVKTGEKAKVTTPRPTSYYDIKNTPLAELKKISSLPWVHAARREIERRKIPPTLHWKIFYCDHFNKWVNSFMPEENGKPKMNPDIVEPRIVIPLLDENKQFFGCQGRALDPNNKIRYISIIADKSRPKLYGLDTCDITKEFFVLEGPFDSMFVDNSVAQLGSTQGFPWNGNEVFIFDNQPRHPDILKVYHGKIENGHKIMIWPDWIESKDVNDAIVDGEIAHADLMKVIRENVFQGLEARLRFNDWKKV